MECPSRPLWIVWGRVREERLQGQVWRLSGEECVELEQGRMGGLWWTGVREESIEGAGLWGLSGV